MNSGPSAQVAHVPLVGRQNEVAKLEALLAAHRLVTVTGACGVGKSHLAVHTAAAMSDRFGGGMVVVDLSLHSVAALPGLLSQVPGRPGQRLLLLDNAEELTTSLPALVSELLQAEPGLTVLCTSLAPLGLPNETRFPLEPLSQTEAARLFVARVTDLAPTAPPPDPAAVDELCRAAGCLPLAIELASELARVVPPDLLAERLRTDLSLLATERAAVPARHRSLHAALARNCGLLRPDAQLLFRRLSVFADRFTLAAAEAVCADASLPTARVLPLLCAVSDLSLVQADCHGEDPVYWLLPAARLYGRSALAAAGEAPAVFARHDDWFLQRVEQISRGKDRARWTQVGQEYGDMEGALHRALESGDGTAALRFCTALSGYWSSRGMVQTGFALLQGALELPCDSAVHRTRALTAAGCMAADLGDLPGGEARLREALARWRELPEPAEQARTLMNLGVALRRLGRYDEAEAAYRESIALQTDLPDQSDLVLTYLNLGVLLGTRGDHVQAAIQFQGAVDTARRIGDQWGAATALSQLALAAIADRRLDDAVAAQTEALVLFRGLGDQLGVAVTLSSLAGVSRELGNPEQALAYYRESAAIALKMRRVSLLLNTLDQMLDMLLAVQQPEAVARLLGFCDQARRREQAPRSPQLSTQVQRVTEACSQALGGTWFGALYRAGSLMSL